MRDLNEEDGLLMADLHTPWTSFAKVTNHHPSILFEDRREGTL